MSDGLKVQAGRGFVDEFTASRWNTIVDLTSTLGAGGGVRPLQDMSGDFTRFYGEEVTFTIQKPKANFKIPLFVSVCAGGRITRVDAVGGSNSTMVIALKGSVIHPDFVATLASLQANSSGVISKGLPLHAVAFAGDHGATPSRGLLWLEVLTVPDPADSITVTFWLQH